LFWIDSGLLDSLIHPDGLVCQYLRILPSFPDSLLHFSIISLIKFDRPRDFISTCSVVRFDGKFLVMNYVTSSFILSRLLPSLNARKFAAGFTIFKQLSVVRSYLSVPQRYLLLLGRLTVV
jgi:hypothetical protein